MSDPGAGTSSRGRWLRRVAWTVLGVVVFLLLINVGPPVWRVLLGLLPRSPTLGLIYVDTPEVYTRERLVNDRFRQEAWLDFQLDRTDVLIGEGAFAGVEGASTRREQHAVGASGDILVEAGGGEVSAAGRDLDAVKDPAAPHGGAFVPAPVDLFRDAQAYRDEIRAEMMRTQLDDRHDIEGNTLYRLNFDATIAPGGNTTALAWIKVTVEEDTVAVEGDGDGREPWLRNYAVLYADWHKRMQAEIDKAVDGQSRDLLGGGGLVGTDRAALQELLENRICDALDRVVAHVDWDPKKDTDTSSDAAASACPDVEEALDRSKHGEARDRDRSNVREALDGYIAAYMRALRMQLDWDYANQLHEELQRLRNWKDLPPQLGALAERKPPQVDVPPSGDQLGKAWFDAVAHVRKQCQTAVPKTGQPPVFTLSLAGGATAALPCPRDLGAHEPVRGAITLLDRLHRLDDPHPDRPLTPTDLGVEDPQDMIGQIICVVRPYVSDGTRFEDEDCDSVPSDRFRDSYDLDWDSKKRKERDDKERQIRGVTPVGMASVRRIVAEFLRAKLNDELEVYHVVRPIKDFFNNEIAGCELGACTVVLRPKFDEIEREEHLTRGGALAFDRATINELRCRLNENAQVFPYAVAPEELVQRLASETSTRLSLQAALRAAAAADASTVGGLIAGLTELEDRIELLHRNPIVVGFGDVDPDDAARDDAVRDDAAQDDRCDTTNPPRATFGWVVWPRLMPKQTPGAEGYRQMARHYPLSAVVSVPSWWKAFKVTVRTDWIDDGILSERSVLARSLAASVDFLARLRAPSGDEADAACEDDPPHPLRSTCKLHRVQVPGSVNEINERLNYEVRKEPYIDHDATGSRGGQELEIGRPGRVVLEGGRLWRSTVVTLGHQRADKITVLPDMDGIIAEFSCVEPPPGLEGYAAVGRAAAGRNAQAAESDPRLPQLVTVWTSEGRTAVPFPVELRPFVARGNAVPCFLGGSIPAP